MYTPWQQKDDRTRFVLLFTFADEDTHRANGGSDAVTRVEEVYRPVLVGEPVVFTDSSLVATNRHHARRPLDEAVKLALATR